MLMGLSSNSLTSADLRRAHLRDADLRNGNLHQADLSGALLEGVAVERAALDGAAAEGAPLTDCGQVASSARAPSQGGRRARCPPSAPSIQDPGRPGAHPGACRYWPPATARARNSPTR
jgi:hypothetical protein